MERRWTTARSIAEYDLSPHASLPPFPTTQTFPNPIPEAALQVQSTNRLPRPAASVSLCLSCSHF